MNISKLQKDAHEMAVSKGWYDQTRSPLELLMLITSEAAECAEEFRNGAPPIYQNQIEERQSPYPTAGKTQIPIKVEISDPRWKHDLKPEGWLIELADVIIRCVDMAGAYNADLEKAIELKMRYNATRPQRHGGKRF